MDLFSQAIYEFRQLPHTSLWPEAVRVFQIAAARKPEHWLIPVRACEAVGGTQVQAVFPIVAIGCAHVGILLVDDMLDDDPRGDYHQIGMPAASNLACFLQAAALQATARSAPDPLSQLAAMNSMNEMFFSTACGQYLDLQAPSVESEYWRVTKTKSSPFFGAALELGALAGGATPEIAAQLNSLGCLYGEMIQIHDDIHDCMEKPANPDWLQERSPLPILFASMVGHPDREHFLGLKKQVQSPDILEEVQEILIRCGAISYCADQLIERHQKATKILDRIPLVNHRPISTLFDEIIAPVNNLLNAME